MTYTSLALFGSYARGDETDDSDIDILSVSEGSDGPGLLEIGKIRISSYARGHLQSLAKTGSLFVLHLKTDGVVVFDRNDTLRSILSDFTPRASYSTERSEAAILGWLLFCSEARDSLTPLAQKTMMFSIRTIAYSLMAESGRPDFSKNRVLQRMSDNNLDTLWNNKYSSGNRIDLDALRKFLTKHTGPPPAWIDHSLIDALRSKTLPTRFARRRCIDLLLKTTESAEDPAFLRQGYSS